MYEPYRSPLEAPFLRDDELAHHGIMGMKWGVWNEETIRKYTGGGKQGGRSVGETFKKGLRVIKTTAKRAGSQAKDKLSSAKTTRKQKQNAREYRKLEKRDPVKLMTDEELKKRIARLQLEQQYKNLTTKQVTKGQSLVAKAIASGLQKGLETGIKGALSQYVAGKGKAKQAVDVAKGKVKADKVIEDSKEKPKAGLTAAWLAEARSAGTPAPYVRKTPEIKTNAADVKKAWESFMRDQKPSTGYTTYQTATTYPRLDRLHHSGTSKQNRRR